MGSPQTDQRGRHEPKNKTPEEDVQFVRAHIQSFPTESSHYSQKDNPNRRAMSLKCDDLDKQILQCHSELSKICPVVLLNSILTKIQELNATLFKHLHQIKTLKLEHLIGPKISSHATIDSQNTIAQIPENLPPTDSSDRKKHRRIFSQARCLKRPSPHSVESLFP